MQKITPLLYPEQINPAPVEGMSYEEQRCEWLNKVPGDLIGYDCPDCLNRGGSYQMRGNEMVFVPCKCIPIRQSLNRIKASGIHNLDKYTFENYRTESIWQEILKENAMQFVKAENGAWFFAGGQVGSGKTHICTAIVGELINSGKKARYMLWRDDGAKLKSLVNDKDRYYSMMEPLKKTEVLYIDDFLKTPRGESGIPAPPTVGDINVAFELLNYRYMDQNLITVISCEHFLSDIEAFDESVGSRIYQRSRGFCNNIKRDTSRNYRMIEED